MAAGVYFPMATQYIDERLGVDSNAAVKAACRAIATVAVTLSGQQTIDGVPLNVNDRVLVNGQADPTTNGIYFASTGAWTRCPDFDGPYDAQTGTLVFVFAGTANAGTLWKLLTTDNPVVFGISNLTFGPAGIVENAGTIDCGTF